VAAAASSREEKTEVLEDSLMRLHYRLGQLNFDAIERQARNSDSGVKITNPERRICIPCAEGKQARNKQPRPDSGEHAPTDVPGGIICSDLKGPMSPADRLGNKYMVNFVDHKRIIAGYF
jgi:hypothetical protein